MYIHGPYTCLVPAEATISLELDLQMVLSSHVGANN